jgi:hypothetical protein
MMGAIVIFGKSSFIFNYVGYGLMTKSLGGWVKEVAEKTKCQKMNVKFLQPN